MECSKLGIEVFQYKVYERGAFLTAIVSGIVTGDAPVCYWPVFFPVHTYSPTSLCKVNTT